MRRRAFGVRPSNGASRRAAILSTSTGFSCRSSSGSRSSARTVPGAGSPPTRARAAPRGRAPRSRPAHRAAPAGPSAAVTCSAASVDLLAATRAARVPDDDAADAAHHAGQRVGRQAAGQPPELRLAAGERRGGPRRLPVRRLGGRGELGLRGRRVAQEQRDQLAPAPLALALALRALLRIALDGVGRQLLDVGEDRLGERADHPAVEARAARGLRQPPPGDARADAVRRLERVERAALAELAAAEGDVHVAAGLAPAVGVADQGDELAQRLGHAHLHPAPEGALERSGVLGDLAGDRAEDLGR